MTIGYINIVYKSCFRCKMRRFRERHKATNYLYNKYKNYYFVWMKLSFWKIVKNRIPSNQNKRFSMPKLRIPRKTRTCFQQIFHFGSLNAGLETDRHLCIVLQSIWRTLILNIVVHWGTQFCHYHMCHLAKHQWKNVSNNKY